MKIHSIMTFTCTVVMVAQFCSADALESQKQKHSEAELKDVTGVDSIIVFKSGVQAYSNRKYQWADVPEKFSTTYCFTMIPGGGVTPVSARVVNPGWLFLAISEEADESARDYLRVNGWQQTTDSFAYTAGRKTTMFVYKKQLSLGMLELPRLGWAGPVLLIQKTDVSNQPDEDTPMAVGSSKEKTVISPPVVLKSEQVPQSNIESSRVSRAKTSSKEIVQSVPLVNSPTPVYKTIHDAVAQGNLADVKRHLQKGAEIDAKDNYYGKTPLMVAVDRKNLDVVKFLIDKGADVNAKDKNGMTPLILAVSYCQLDIVKFMLGKGADVNAKDKDGKTLLMLALNGGNLDVVKFLVAKGADVNAKNKNGKTPIMLARESRNLALVENMVKFLKQHGAKE